MGCLTHSDNYMFKNIKVYWIYHGDKMAETVFTLRLHGDVVNLLDEIIKMGYSESKTEAVRAALIVYATRLGLVSKRKLHQNVLDAMRKSGKRYTPEEVMKHIEEAR